MNEDEISKNYDERDTLYCDSINQKIIFRHFESDDIYKLADVNLDPLTYTFNEKFYFQYLTDYIETSFVAINPYGRIVGYILGCYNYVTDDHENIFHAHISALSVCPSYRSNRIADKLVEYIINFAKKEKCAFISLFVNTSNEIAIKFYYKIGFRLFKREPNYYGIDEDAFILRYYITS